MNSYTLEVPVDTIEAASLAVSHAERLEVCSNLLSEGWTPERELLKDIIELGSHHNTEVISLIRPQILIEEELDAQHFEASDEIMEASIASIEDAGELGAHGIAIGLLNSDGSIDHDSCQTLIEKAKQYNLEVSFLRTFDLTPDRAAAIRILTNIGVSRILTTGMRGWNISEVSIERRIETLKRDVLTAKQAATSEERSPLQIMPGGGIRSSNVMQFASISPFLHSSCRGPDGFEIDELISIKGILGETE